MVVHEDNESAMEIPASKPVLKQKSYVIVKNHVREIKKNTQKADDGSLHPLSHNKLKKKKSKCTKLPKKSKEHVSKEIASKYDTKNTTVIDSADLEELKTVYMKCKEVMKTIERKYGHLLDLDSFPGPSTRSMKRKLCSDASEEECECKIKKKIVFDEEGQQIEVDSTLEKHICVNKLKKPLSEPDTRCQNIQIEYTDTEVILPDSLIELNKMLQDRSTDKLIRNKVLEKIRMIRQDYMNEIRFNKHILIEKLKSNPDEVFSFKGANLSTIPGYS